MIDQSELNPSQFPAWAEFTPVSEDTTVVAPREGFRLDNVIDNMGAAKRVQVGAGFIAKEVDGYRLFDGAKITISGGSISGYVGPQGPVGPAGPQGIQGLRGIQGLQGIQGEIGYTNTDGGRANSIYSSDQIIDGGGANG